MKVLLAEDDGVSRTILRRAVEKLGHECLAAADGEEAWRMYQESPDTDVLISDWMMPRVDGLELCQRVRADKRDGYTYFIFLTALADKDHLRMGLEAGADDYLSKPLDRGELQVRLISASRVTSLHQALAGKNVELERLNERLFEQARQDPMTGLGNRLRLHEELGTLEGRATRYGHRYSAILCDVDFFKKYNDHYGHLAGDEVLRRVAGAISAHCRTGDTAYRYGGEEFLIILPEQTIESAKAAAERLRRAVENLEIYNEARVPPGPVTVSLGVAELSPESSQDVNSVLKEADEALYRAKEAGRNRVFSYSEVSG